MTNGDWHVAYTYDPADKLERYDYANGISTFMPMTAQTG